MARLGSIDSPSSGARRAETRHVDAAPLTGNYPVLRQHVESATREPLGLAEDESLAEEGTCRPRLRDMSDDPRRSVSWVGGPAACPMASVADHPESVGSLARRTCSTLWQSQLSGMLEDRRRAREDTCPYRRIIGSRAGPRHSPLGQDVE